MDDASLAAFLGFSEVEAKIAIPNLSPERRAVYDRMAEVEIDIGLGINPPGVIVCREKGHRR